MISSDILNSIECAIPHECSKLVDESLECGYCKVGYSFIVCEPIVLECGYHICKECIAKTENRNLKFQICSKEIKCTNGAGTAAETLVKVFSKDLAKELKEKFLKGIHVYDGRCLILLYL
jgi:hypothetical protein